MRIKVPKDKLHRSVKLSNDDDVFSDFPLKVRMGKIWKSVEVKVAYESLDDFKGIFKAD